MPKSTQNLFMAFLLVLVPLCTSAAAGLGVKNNMRSELLMPKGNGPFPAVLILHTSGGVTPANFDYAKRLAEKGYASLIPYYFDANDIRSASRGTALNEHAEEVLADLLTALDYLKSNPRIDKDRLAAVGFSMGGYWALLLAAKGQVQAGVSYYGVLSGFGLNKGSARYQFQDVFDENSSPVLILHGEMDTTQPVAGAHRLSALLERKQVAFEKYIYPYVGHRFEIYHNAAAADSWNKTLEFFDKYLSTKRPPPELQPSSEVR